MKTQKMILKSGDLFSLPPSSGPCKCLPGKRENRENLLRERRRGGGEATDGERGGVTAEREERGRKGQQKRELSWFLVFSLCCLTVGFFYSDFFMSCERNSWRICKIRSSLQLILKSHNWGPESSHRCGNFLFQVVLRTDLYDKGSTYLVFRIIWRRRRQRLQKGVKENHLPLAAIGGNARFSLNKNYNSSRTSLVCLPLEAVTTF